MKEGFYTIREFLAMIKKEYGIEINENTLYGWIGKEKVSAYTNDLSGKLYIPKSELDKFKLHPIKRQARRRSK